MDTGTLLARVARVIESCQFRDQLPAAREYAYLAYRQMHYMDQDIYFGWVRGMVLRQLDGIVSFNAKRGVLLNADLR